MVVYLQVQGKQANNIRESPVSGNNVRPTFKVQPAPNLAPKLKHDFLTPEQREKRSIAMPTASSFSSATARAIERAKYMKRAKAVSTSSVFGVTDHVNEIELLKEIINGFLPILCKIFHSTSPQAKKLMDSFINLSADPDNPDTIKYLIKDLSSYIVTDSEFFTIVPNIIGLLNKLLGIAIKSISVKSHAPAAYARGVPVRGVPVRGVSMAHAAYAASAPPSTPPMAHAVLVRGGRKTRNKRTTKNKRKTRNKRKSRKTSI